MAKMTAMARTNHARLAVYSLPDSNVRPVKVFDIVLRNVRRPTGKFTIESALRSWLPRRRNRPSSSRVLDDPDLQRMAQERRECLETDVQPTWK